MVDGSILISVTHVPFFIPGVIHTMDQHKQEGAVVLMEEAAFDNSKQAKDFLQRNGFPKEELDFLLEKVKYGAFFPKVREHAEKAGMKVVSADGCIGREYSRNYFLELCRATLEGKRGNSREAYSISSKAEREFRHADFLNLKRRNEEMLRLTKDKQPRMVVVGRGHGSYLKRRYTFSKTYFVGNPLTFWHEPVYAFKGWLARKEEKRKNRKRRK